MAHRSDRRRHRPAERAAGERVAVDGHGPLEHAAAFVRGPHRQVDRAADMTAGRADRSLRCAVVTQHDGESVKPRRGLAALKTGAAQVAARTDPQRVGAVRVGDHPIAAEVDWIRADVAARRVDVLPATTVARLHDERRHRPRPGA